MIKETNKILKLFPASKVGKGEVYREIKNPNFRLLIHKKMCKKYTLFLDDIETDDFEIILKLLKTMKECNEHKNI